MASDSILDTINRISDAVGRAATTIGYRSVGMGHNEARYQTLMQGVDRFGLSQAIPQADTTGLTFITRPQLNFSDTNLRQTPIMSMLDTYDHQSLPFAIRCYLDTMFAKNPAFHDEVVACPFLNNKSPFITPLSNTIMSLSGWPDPVLDVNTTEGGYYSQNQTSVAGYDFLNGSNELNITFQEIEGSVVSSLFMYWLLYMGYCMLGVMSPYPKNIEHVRLDYTCSIYRFVLDHRRERITKWAKATGCFPKALPIGDFFNIGEREDFVSAAQQLSIPFVVNHVEYMDPRIFSDFNLLVSRFAGSNWWQQGDMEKVPVDAFNNFVGTPYIEAYGQLNELNFYAPRSDIPSLNT